MPSRRPIVALFAHHGTRKLQRHTDPCTSTILSFLQDGEWLIYNGEAAAQAADTITATATATAATTTAAAATATAAHVTLVLSPFYPRETDLRPSQHPRRPDNVTIVSCVGDEPGGYDDRGFLSAPDGMVPDW